MYLPKTPATARGIALGIPAIPPAEARRRLIALLFDECQLCLEHTARARETLCDACRADLRFVGVDPATWTPPDRDP